MVGGGRNDTVESIQKVEDKLLIKKEKPLSFERTGAIVVAIVEIERNDHSLASVCIDFK